MSYEDVIVNIFLQVEEKQFCATNQMKITNKLNQDGTWFKRRTLASRNSPTITYNS